MMMTSNALSATSCLHWRRRTFVAAAQHSSPDIVLDRGQRDHGSATGQRHQDPQVSQPVRPCIAECRAQYTKPQWIEDGEARDNGRHPGPAAQILQAAAAQPDKSR